MIRRSLAQQQRDYLFLRRLMNQLQQRRGSSGATRSDILGIAKYLLTSKGTVSYFQLHKLAYLTEYVHVRRAGRRLTSAYFIRQEEGPYCTDLEINRLRRADGSIHTVSKGGKLRLQLGTDQMLLACIRAARLDCFGARAPRNDGERMPEISPRHCERSAAIQEPRKQAHVSSTRVGRRPVPNSQ